VNFFDIYTTAQLNDVEKDLSAIRLYELSTSPIQGNLDLAHLKAIHLYLFQDIYPWAGQLREVDIVKGNDTFSHFADIPRQFDDLAEELKLENYLVGHSKEDFSNRLGYYLGRINTMHPFREGNGRSQRVFCDAVASRADYEIDWGSIGNSAMVEACKDAFTGNYKKLERQILLNLLQKT
jgi:cell filamentation protein